MNKPEKNHHQPSVLITGASSGIGRGCAEALARVGWRVFAGVRREVDGDALRRIEANIQPVLLDVTKREQVDAAITLVGEAVGTDGLDGLVNCAGIVTGGPIECLDPDVLREQLEVNVIGVVAVTQAALPLLRTASKARGRSRIVMISSISGRIAMPFIGPYAVSKFALEAMSDALRAEVVRWGIGVSLIEPGPIETAIWDKSLARFEDQTARWTEAQHGLYGEQMRAVRQLIGESIKAAEPVERVVRAVCHALTARRARIRYPIGRQTRIILAIWPFLPDRLRDAIVQRELKRGG